MVSYLTCKTADLEPLTVAQVLALRAARHVAAVYPRRGEVVVDGFRRYRLAGRWPKGERLV
jgi:hypothetical protein